MSPSASFIMDVVGVDFFIVVFTALTTWFDMCDMWVPPPQKIPLTKPILGGDGVSALPKFGNRTIDHRSVSYWMCGTSGATIFAYFASV